MVVQNNSRSQRILWLLEELGVTYTLKKYERMPDKRAPKELLAVHPLGKSPVVTDGPVTLAESGAVQYLIEKYGAGKATPPKSGKIDNLYFTHYSEGTLMPLRVNGYVFSLVPDHSPFYLRPIVRLIMSQLQRTLVDPGVEANIVFIDAHLEKTGGLFAGGENLTSADYMMSFLLEALAASSITTPRIDTFLRRIQARPAYQRVSWSTSF
ncbi:hypothetical protein PLICRDRAFT_173766 [Plicaturopsis crispa FD-325 SS-3]|nr:hypothetical protein PLICRDRAFT_173766 [Plicaturopsis crispa FD-325 SS-3]